MDAPDEELPSLDEAPTIPSDKRPLAGALATMGQAFGPVRFSPSLAATSGVRSAKVFALFVSVPLMLISGLIPYTHLFHFGAAFSVEVDAGNHTLDLLRAAGLGLLTVGLSYGFLGASIVSLAGAFGRGREGGNAPKEAALRAVLYRSWLAPMVGVFGLPAMLAAWALPSLDGALGIVLLVAMIGPFVLLFLNLHAAARYAAGCTMGASIVVTLVPVMLFLVVQLVLVGEPPGTGVLQPLLPTVPEAM